MRGQTKQCLEAWRVNINTLAGIESSDLRSDCGDLDIRRNRIAVHEKNMLSVISALRKAALKNEGASLDAVCC